MARRRRQTQPIDPLVPVVPPITDAPGPEADISVLKAHYRLVQDALAVHAYDDTLYICLWCLADAPLTNTKIATPRGTRKFCSREHAEAHAAYMKGLQRERPAITPTEPSDSDETEDDSYEAPPTFESRPVTGLVGEEKED